MERKRLPHLSAVGLNPNSTARPKRLQDLTPANPQAPWLEPSGTRRLLLARPVSGWCARAQATPRPRVEHHAFQGPRRTPAYRLHQTGAHSRPPRPQLQPGTSQALRKRPQGRRREGREEGRKGAREEGRKAAREEGCKRQQQAMESRQALLSDLSPPHCLSGETAARPPPLSSLPSRKAQLSPTPLETDSEQ